MGGFQCPILAHQSQLQQQHLLNLFRKKLDAADTCIRFITSTSDHAAVLLLYSCAERDPKQRTDEYVAKDT